MWRDELFIKNMVMNRAQLLSSSLIYNNYPWNQRFLFCLEKYFSEVEACFTKGFVEKWRNVAGLKQLS